MKVQKQTKRFAEITSTNFEYDNQNFTVVSKNVAVNDETRITQYFNPETLVIELQITL